MLVQRLKLFIIELRKLSSIKSFDGFFLSSLENTFLTLEPNQVLTDELICQLKYIFLQRWNLIVDTPDDYTRGSNQGVNALCISLSIEIAAEKNDSPLKLLTPAITTCYDPILLKPFNLAFGRHSLSWFILNEDSTNFINILSWYIETKRGICAKPSYWDDTIQLSSEKNRDMSSRTFATYVDLKSYHLRAFTLRELLRLRIKGDALTTDFSFTDETGVSYTNFWNYLQCRIMPSWNNFGKLPVQSLPSLLALVDIYFTEARGSCSTGTFRSHLLIWAKNLHTCTVHDVNHLYGQIVQVDEKPAYLIDVLINLLHFDHGSLKAEVKGLAHFLGKYDASYVIDHVELYDVYRSLKIGPSFGVEELIEDLIQIKDIAGEQLEGYLIALISDLETKHEIDLFIIEKLIYLYAKRWFEIKNTELDYRNSTDSKNQKWVRLAQKLSTDYLELNYQSFLMPNENMNILEWSRIKRKYGSVFYTFYNRTYNQSIHPLGYSFAYIKPMLRNIPRHVLPDLLEIMEAYFVNTIVKFRELVDNWIINLQDCYPEDVQFLYEQIIQVNNKPIYFIDALLDMRYEPPQVAEEIVFGMLAWLCCFDQSFISQLAQVQGIYSSMKLGHAFDINALIGRLQKLASKATLTVLSTLEQILLVVQTKETIDKSVIDALSNLYKYRWQVIQGQDDCYTRQQDGVNKEWIDLAAALSGARLIPQNYYRFLMPSIVVDIDSVKRVSIVHYPLNHYLIAGVSFDQLILLDNCVEQYLSDNTFMTTVQFRESHFLYNCNSENRVPLNREEHGNILYAHHRFHKFFYLTQTPDNADQSIKLATLDALTALAEGSVFPHGVKFLFDYNDDELKCAERAYDVFCEFYNQLPEDEKQRLNNQLIHFNGTCKSFKKLLFEINSYQCIAKVGQYILQLIVDYLPNRKFVDTIEIGSQVQVLGENVRASVGLDKIRLNSGHKIPSDAIEFEQRAYLLLFSILTQPFEFVTFNAATVSAFNYVNHIILVAKDLFTRISLMINANDFTSYSELVYAVVRPALVDNGFFTKLWSKKNRVWLESIENGSFADELRLQRLLDTHMGRSQSRDLGFFQLRSTDTIVSTTNHQNTVLTSTSK